MVRRRRRLNENISYAGGFTPGNIVVVTAPDIFKGSEIGYVSFPLKHCEGVPVHIRVSDKEGRYVCIDTSRGHTIIKATKQK